MTGSASERIVSALKDHGVTVTGSAARGSWRAKCPAHDGTTADSLAIRQIEGQVLLHCFAGCNTQDVVKEIGQTMPALFDDPNLGVRYRYDDGRVVLRGWNTREQKRSFGQSGKTKGPTQLYRLGEIQVAVAAGKTIYLTEGEKDTHSLEAIGLVATTSPMGAKNWDKVDPTPLTGATVIIVADQDPAGETYAAAAKISLEELRCKVTVVRPKTGKDAADHVAAGHGPDDFIRTEVDPWGEPPTALSSIHCLTPFPTHALPDVMRDMVEAEARATQTDPGLVASVGLAVLATAAGGCARVEIRDGWSEPVNLFVLPAAEPGTRKSSVFATMTAPLRGAAKELADKDADKRWEVRVEYDVETRAADKLKEEAAKLAAEGAKKRKEYLDKLSEAQTKRAYAESIKVPADPRLLADDCTPEALVTLLAENDGRIAIISAEGGLFELLSGRYSPTPNLDGVLKGHAGDVIQVDRKGRPSELVENPALTMALTVQPVVLEQIGRNETFIGRGLLARFMFSIPADKVGFRMIAPPPVPSTVAQAYTELTHNLAVKLTEKRASGETVVLRFDPAAEDAFLVAEIELEPRLAGDLRPIKEWASKSMGAVARIAGLLHLAAHSAGKTKEKLTFEETSISEETVIAALEIVEYYTQHALVVFSLMGVDPTVRAAKELLDHIRRHGVEESSARDLHVNLPRSRFPQAGDVAEALTVLVEHGYALPLPSPPRPGPGRRPSPRYRFRPATPATENTQSTQSETAGQTLGVEVGGDES